MILELPKKLPQRMWIARNVTVFLNILFAVSIAGLAFVITVFISTSLSVAESTSGNAYLSIINILLGSLIIWITAKRIESIRKRWENERTKGLTLITQKLIKEWVNYNYIFDINSIEAQELMLTESSKEDIISFNQHILKPDFYLFGSIRKQQQNKNWIEISLVWQYDKFILVYKNKGFKEIQHKLHEYEEN